jgi:hypothetical protein
MSKPIKAGEGRGEHRTPRDTRRITEARLREAGFDQSTARRAADAVARDVHDKP